jgi:Flp pilus assembly protein TadG
MATMGLSQLIKVLSSTMIGLRAFVAERRASMAPMFALTIPVIALVVAGAVDFSMAVGAKSDLQDAADAASLAVSTAVAANPNTTEAALKTLAVTTLAANYHGASSSVTDFHVCAPVQNDCTDGSLAMKMDTVTLAASAPSSCAMAAVLPSVCTNGSQTVNAKTTTVIGFGATFQLNIVMDSSASMIVGSTANDVTLISTWVGKHWSSVKPNDPAPYANGGDNPPCAFACHDVGDSTTATDIATGLTNAHAAGATTRFDVMIKAATDLVNHVQTEVTAATNTTLVKNTYVYNVMSFDTSVHNYGSTNMTYSSALTAIGTVKPGLDTYLSTAMSQLITKIGSNGTGASAASPLKFMILVTDGLQSDRDSNWTCSSNGYDSAWNFSPTCFGGYATPISQAQCTTLKNNGIVLAVLETPYVPLTGQSPQVQPYEKTVRHVIYPGGSSAPSALSAALSSCASDGYYFQAVDSTDIETGFFALTDKFLARSSYISK